MKYQFAPGIIRAGRKLIFQGRMGEFSTSSFLPRLSEGINFGLQSAFPRSLGIGRVLWHFSHIPSQLRVTEGVPTQQGLDVSRVDGASTLLS